MRLNARIVLKYLFRYEMVIKAICEFQVNGNLKLT